MSVFYRLLSYSLKYKYRFSAGVSFALITALLNGLSLSALIPLFDSLGSESKSHFELKLTLPEEVILAKEFYFGSESLDGLEKLKKSIINVKIYINNVMSNYSSKEAVWMICLTIFPLYIFKLIFYLLSVFCIATSGYRAVRDIRQELFDKVQRLPLSYFYKEKTGLVMSRIVNDAEVVAAVISSNLRDAIINFFYVFTHLLILLYLNADLLISALLVIPVVILPVTLFTKKISKSTEKFQERMGDLNAHLQETISGIKIIRSFNTEQKEFKKFNEINHKV